MKNNNRFLIILAIVIGLIIIGGGTYSYTSLNDDNKEGITKDDTIALSETEIEEKKDSNEYSGKKYENSESNNENIINSEQVETNEQGQGATYSSDEERIQVILPGSGDELEIGDEYEIQWGNYSGDQKLTISLQTIDPAGEVISSVGIATDVLNIGVYVWTVTSQDSNNTYKIEMHPNGARNLVGRSESFTISGEELIVINSHKPYDAVDASVPIEISGVARDVYSEGEFDVKASYVLDGEKQIVSESIASCSLGGNGCDWTSSNLESFKAVIDLSESPVCTTNIEFYARNDKAESAESFYTLNLRLIGINDCQ